MSSETVTVNFPDTPAFEVPRRINGWEYVDVSTNPGVVYIPKDEDDDRTADSIIQAVGVGSGSYSAELRLEGDREGYLTSRSIEQAVDDARQLARNNSPPSCGCSHSGQTSLSGDCYDPTEEFDR